MNRRVGYQPPVTAIYTSFGHRLDQLMYDRNINNTELANAIGCGRKTIYKIKEGESTSMDKIIRIANYFNVSLDYLIYGKE